MTHDQTLLTFDRYKLDLLRRVKSHRSLATSLPGFTLIETIVYIALLSLIMTGAVVTAYDLIGSASQSSTQATTQEEGSFAIRKIGWALSGMSSTTVPAIAGSGCDQTMTVQKPGYADNPIVFRRNAASSMLEMSEAGGSYVAITTINASSSCLQFSTITESGVPVGISATTTIDGQDFSVTRYARW